MAKYVYPAVFTHEAEGGYSITFPDLPDCATSAETLEEGIEMAADALCLILYDMEEGGAVPPEPSDVRSIVCAENQLVTLIRCDTIEYRKFFDNRAVKKTLTIPAWLNTMAERQGVNYFYTHLKQESGDRAVSALFCCAQTFNCCGRRQGPHLPVTQCRRRDNPRADWGRGRAFHRPPYRSPPGP